MPVPTIGPLGVVVFGILSRAFITAANSAMFIAAPELYATRTRTLGVNIAFVLNLVGAAPASLWVSSDAHKVTTAAAIAAANLVAGLCAWGLPETSGRSLSEAPAAAPKDYGTIERG